MFTSNDLRDQVAAATDASEGTYDIDAITAEIIEQYGAVDIDTIDSSEFWKIVGKHATDNQPTGKIVLVNAYPHDRVPGIELSELESQGRELSFLREPHAAIDAWFDEVGYGPDRPDELVYAFPADDYQTPTGYPSATFDVPAADVETLRKALADA